MSAPTIVDLRGVDQLTLPPRERIDTMTQPIPEYTMGFAWIGWIYDHLTHSEGERSGLPFQVTPRQARFLVHLGAVDGSGSLLCESAVRRLAKGSGKSPFAAVLALLFMLGPIEVASYDDSVPGGVTVQRPGVMQLVQLAAVKAAQTANVMRHIRVMATGRNIKRAYHLDVGKQYVDEPTTGARIEVVTTAPGSAEGANPVLVLADETQHWIGNTPRQFYDTLRGNVAKYSGGLVVSTTNAWAPGSESVAEADFDIWVEQQEGKRKADRGILYDALIAPPNAVLHDNPRPGEIGLTETLEFIYQDCAWVNIDRQRTEVQRASAARARRFWFNRPSVTDGAWVGPHHWSRLHDPNRTLVEGEDVVLFFDGSLSNDFTALVGCCMSDGHVFTVGVWAPEDIGQDRKRVDIDAVDTAVRAVRERYTVVAFWADVREWESFVKIDWPELFADAKLIPAGKSGTPSDLIAWDMRSKGWAFGSATEHCFREITEGHFTHDGNPETTKHITNAQAKETKHHIVITKPSRSAKIDAAVCVIGARMVYRHVKENPDYLKRQTAGAGWSLF